MHEDRLAELAFQERRCPACGGGVEEFDKFTGLGRDIRFLRCVSCSWSASLDVGIATWKAMSEAKNEHG